MAEDTGGNEVVIQVRDLSFSYGDRVILEDVNLEVRRGEIVTVMGPSGCGKTTLLRLMVGLLRPEAGELVVLGRNVNDLDEDELQDFRRRIGMCFQFGALLNSLPVYDNLALPLREYWQAPEELVSIMVRSCLAVVGLSGSECLLPGELSGGMRKRAGLARALMLDPEVLFFDEPTSGLDPTTAADLDQTLLELKRRLQPTMVVVSHDLASAQIISDRMVVLLRGRIAVQGTPEEVRSCEDPAVAAFVQRKALQAEHQESDGFLSRYFE